MAFPKEKCFGMHRVIVHTRSYPNSTELKYS